MTNEEIIQRGQLINDETEPAQNTSERVGGVIKGIGQNLADKDTAIAAEAARNGYYQCTVSGTTLAVTAPGFTLPAHGGNIRIKMSAPATGASTLNINGTGPKALLYNGAALSSANTWEKDEIISVFYDPSGSGQYLASNSQGGGAGLKIKNATADLDVADENNNVIARFEGGEVMTKKFNSASTPAQGDSAGDLDFADEQGNVVMRVANGHVKTKYFDSSKSEALFKYKTIRPSFIGGNVLNSTISTGSIIAFGTIEENAMKYIHSRLFNVLPSSMISFNCDIDLVEIKVLFFTKNYEKVSSPVVHNSGDGWNDCSVNVPSTASMAIFQLLVSDGNGGYLNDCNLSVLICLNLAMPTIFFPRSANGYQHLTMKVGFSSPNPNSDTPSNQLQIVTRYYPDHGILCLPPSYTPDGEPTRMICFTHGHAVSYTQNSTTFNSTDIDPTYWLSEGYAIFDMDGSVIGYNFGGNYEYEPAAINSYDTAYEWIVRHYNIRTDGIFTSGRSQGGGMQLVLAKRSKMPILALAPIAVYVGPMGYFGRKYSKTARKELLLAYGVPESEVNSISWSGSGTYYFHQLTEAQRNMIHDNQYRFNPYTMFCYSRPLTMEEMILYSEADVPSSDSNYNETQQNAKYEAFYESVTPSLNPSTFNNKPFIMFICVSDDGINHKSVEMFHKMMTNAGQLMQLHVFPQPSVPSPGGSDHRFERNTENLVTYTNSKGITLENVPIVYIEALAFWRKFENQDQNNNN